MAACLASRPATLCEPAALAVFGKAAALWQAGRPSASPAALLREPTGCPSASPAALCKSGQAALGGKRSFPWLQEHMTWSFLPAFKQISLRFKA